MSLLNVTQAEHEVRAKRKVRGRSAIQEKQLSPYLATDLMSMVPIETAWGGTIKIGAKLAHWQEIKCIKGQGVSKITHCLPFCQICFNGCYGARSLAVFFCLSTAAYKQAVCMSAPSIPALCSAPGKQQACGFFPRR